MSCSFWNMRRKLRRQLGIERSINEETVNTNLSDVKKEVQEVTDKPVETKPKKRGAK